MRIHYKKLAVFLFLFPFLLMKAQTPKYIVRSNIYVGLDAGIALLDLSRNNLSQHSNPFSLGFYGGFMPCKWLRTGISLKGWLLEPYGDFYDDPSKGISISNTYAQFQIFPFKNYDLYMNLAGGISNYINRHPGEYYAKGIGFLAGLGYEKRLIGNIGISLMVNYGYGKFNDLNYTGISIKNQHYNITEFLFGFSYHFIPKKKTKYKKEKLRKLDDDLAFHLL